MHPLTGHGGNVAIESAAYLANILKTLTDLDSFPSNDSFEAAFSRLNETRQPRTDRLMSKSHGLALAECFDTPFLKFMARKVIPKMPVDWFLTEFTMSCAPAVSLKYLPLPTRSKDTVLPFNDEIKAKPSDRSAVVTNLGILWVLLAASVQLLPLETVIARRGIINVHFNPESPFASDMQAYSSFSSIALNGLMVLESYRASSVLTPLGR
jgi:hypothetical protein